MFLVTNENMGLCLCINGSQSATVLVKIKMLSAISNCLATFAFISAKQTEKPGLTPALAELCGHALNISMLHFSVVIILF